MFKASIAVAVLVAMTGSFASAASGQLYVKVSQTDNKTSSVGLSEPGTYADKEIYATVSMTMQGTGVLASVNTSTAQNSHEVVGQTIQGTSGSKLRILDKAEGLVLWSAKADLTKDGVRSTIAYNAEAKIISGSWDEYMNNGGTIKLRLTADGADIVNRALAASIQDSLVNSLKSSLSGARMSPSLKIDKTTDLGTCEASLREMTCNIPRLDVSVNIDVSI